MGRKTNGQHTTDHRQPGMSRVHTLMQQAVTNKVFPGAVLLVSRESSVVFHKAYGIADLSTRHAVTKETVFDLASLTKPLATTLAVMMLIQQNRLGLEQHLGAVLPAFGGDEKSAIKINHLLRHNSGLPDYRPYYKDLELLSFGQRKEALHNMLVKEPLIHPIGDRVLYSDIGFMILAWLIEHICTDRLDRIVSEIIYEPLGLDDLFFAGQKGPQLRDQFAATEQCPWRNRLLVGQVHDENAYVVGGVQGHAGLFGTAAAVQKLLFQLLSVYHGDPAHKLFQTDLVRLFFKRLPETDRALGFDMPAVKNSSAGNYFSTNTVGHLGFSGTSFWMDLNRSIIVIMLTNRIHPTRDNEAIKDFRPVLHNEVMKCLLSQH
jgi:CubicO group peptidase (beta-lactamase class C family)